MFANLFGKGKKQKSSNSTFHIPRAEDKEEDGFLLVGETASDRSTVHASQQCQQYLPPSYNAAGTASVNQSQVGLPSYNYYQERMQHTAEPASHTQGIGPGSYQQSESSGTGFTSSGEFIAESNPSSPGALSGVPFQLSLGLELALKAGDQEFNYFNIISDNRLQPDWSQYCYDFVLEKGVLREAWQNSHR